MCPDLVTRRVVLAEVTPDGAGNHDRTRLLDTAHGHAGVCGLDHHRHAQRLDLFHQQVGDLAGETFLHLGSASEGFDHAGQLADPDDLAFRQTLVTDGHDKWLIWYRYQLGNKFAAVDLDAKIFQMTETLRGRPQSGVVAFAVRCNEACIDAPEILTNFATSVGAQIGLH